MKIRMVPLQPFRCRFRRLGKPLEPSRRALVRRQRRKSSVHPLHCFQERRQSFLIEHHLSLPHCHTLSNCPAVFSNSSWACCFWKFASRYNIHFSFSSSRALSTSRRFSFPSANCACSTATFCCASCNSSRATSFAASLSRTRRVRCLTSAVTSVLLLVTLTLAASRLICASPTAAFVCALNSGTCTPIPALNLFRCNVLYS